MRNNFTRYINNKYIALTVILSITNSMNFVLTHYYHAHHGRNKYYGITMQYDII